MDSFFHNSLAPWQWGLLALVPVGIFALYFLKLKRQPLEVPSTYLWHRVIEDMHVNSLWQRLRRSLLLFLQLLVVGLAMAALLRPGWQGEALEGERFIFLVDNSASMSAADAADGRSRLDEAKEHVASKIDLMTSGMSAMIISFGEQTEVVQEFTDNRRLLLDALDRIKPSAGRTNLRAALELADGFANPNRIFSEEDGREYVVTDESPVELFILSDGRFEDVENFSLGNLRPVFLPIGTFDAANLAITVLSARRSELHPEIRQAFVQVANFAEETGETIVELRLDGQLVDAAEMEIPAGDVAGVTFTLGDVPTGSLRAQLDTPAEFGDRLSLDDRAYAVLGEHRKGRTLLVTPGNLPIELALTTERAQRLAQVDLAKPAMLKTPEYQKLALSDSYNLMIFDQCTPPQMPQCNTLFVGRLPPLDTWKQEGSSEPVFAPQIVDWQREHPLLNLVELGNVQIADSLLTDPPSGGQVLIDSTAGPIFAIAPRDSFEDAVLGFEILGHDAEGQRTVNTNWPRRHSFPNFLLNALEYLAAGTTEQDERSIRPGQYVELRLAAAEAGDASEKFEVVLPDGTRRPAQPPQQGKFAFQETDEQGIYRVEAGDKPLRSFAVNLFDREESDIKLRLQQGDQQRVRVVDSISIGYVDVAAQAQAAPVRRELWKWLLGGALVVLVLEWYIYNRRVYL